MSLASFVTIAPLAARFATISDVPPASVPVFAKSHLDICMRTVAVESIVPRFLESRGPCFHVNERDVMGEVQELLRDFQYNVPSLHFSLNDPCDAANASACPCDVVLDTSTTLGATTLAIAQQTIMAGVVVRAYVVFSLDVCWYTHNAVCAVAREIHEHSLMPFGNAMLAVISVGPLLLGIGWLLRQKGRWQERLRGLPLTFFTTMVLPLVIDRYS